MLSSKRTIRSLTALFFGMTFVFIGSALTVNSIAIILKHNDVSNFYIGIIGSCYFLGAMVSTISAHRIVSKVGHIRSFGIFAIIFGIATMLHSLNSNLYFWMVLRFLLGFCYYALLMVIESWLNEKAKNAIRSRVIAFYEVVFYSSSGFGILLMSFDFPSNTVFILSASFIMFASIPLFLIRIKEPILPQKTKISIPKVFDIVPLALVTSFIAGMLLNGFFSMASLFILIQGFGAKEASIFIFCTMLGGFISQLFIGTLSDKISRKFAIILCAFTALSAMLCILLLSYNIYLKYFFGFLLGMGMCCLYALSLARANDMLDDSSKRVELGRAVLFTYSFGALFAPAVLGTLMYYFQAYGFMYFYIVLLTVLIAFAIDKPKFKNLTKFKRKPGNMVMLDDN